MCKFRKEDITQKNSIADFTTKITLYTILFSHVFCKYSFTCIMFVMDRYFSNRHDQLQNFYLHYAENQYFVSINLQSSHSNKI